VLEKSDVGYDFGSPTTRPVDILHETAAKREVTCEVFGGQRASNIAAERLLMMMLASR
jgi:hypothetical protein